MLTETIQLETMRQKIEDVEYEAGDRANYLDYGKPNPAQAKQAKELIENLNSQSKELRAEFKQLIATVRSQQPQAFEEWINYHIGMLQTIVDENPAGKDARTRKFVAKQTLEQWEKVRAGEQEYVNINWHFLKDYKADVRTITGGRVKKAESNSQVENEGKAWWQFWK